MITLFSLALITGGTAGLVKAQDPPSYSKAELDRLVARIALYPDPLVAQILAAAGYPDQIPEAAAWADEHHYLQGDDLARAITEDRLTWDASVQALLPFPSVVDMMSSDIDWTAELGNAFLAQHGDVMDAIQRQRMKARDYGYLQTNAQVVVSPGPYITILPVNPAFICVPVYDPLVVFAPARAGFLVGGAIRFGFGISIGLAFAPWGWGTTTHFDWGRHDLFIAGAHWGRTWANRGTYVHPYSAFRAWKGPRGPEHHDLKARSEEEKKAAREGRPGVEEHHGKP